MATQILSGPSIPAFDYARITSSVSLGSNTIDATGEKVAFVGPVWFQARTGTKDIRKVGFRFGSVTKAGGSGLTVSLQDVSTSAGPPARPDETQDQTVAIANGNASFASNTWIQTGNLSADRTVAFGEMVAVVIEFDGSGRLGADAVNISGIAGSGGAFAHSHRSHCVLKAGGSWALDSNILPNVILEFSDGTFGTLSDAFPCSAVGGLDYDSGTSPDEYALKFQFPVPVSIDKVGGFVSFDGGSSDAQLICYEGTTPMTNGTVSVDANQSATAGYRSNIAAVFGAELALSAATAYRLAWKPTSANNAQLAYFDVAAAGHFQAHVGGENWHLSSRADGGAWSDVTTRRPFLWPYISSIDDGAGGGGGTVTGDVFAGLVVR